VRIAVVTESFLPSVNGVTTSVLRVVETLKEQGHEVLIIAPTSVGPSYQGCEVVTSPYLSLAGFPVAIPVPFITQALDRFRPDLVHAAAPFWLGGHSIAHAKRVGIPSVAVYQTDVSGYMERYGLDFAKPIIDSWVGLIHKQATLNLVPTATGQAYLAGLGIEQVRLWGRGVDQQLFNPERASSESVRALRNRWAPHGERLVGYVGRLAPEKQVGRLRELLDLPNTRLVIIGDGPDRPELEDQFAGHLVVFAGALSGDDLGDAYAALDVFVHCGTEETFGQTIQEAQASGLPVVVANRGGPRHLINSGWNGFLVDPDVWGAFRRQVEALLADDELWATVSRQARFSVAGKTWKRNNEQLLAYYGEAFRVLAGARENIPLAA